MRLRDLIVIAIESLTSRVHRYTIINIDRQEEYAVARNNWRCWNYV